VILPTPRVNFICHLDFPEYVNFIDGEDSIIVPKSVRPIISYEETFLGNKKGAKKQYRYGNLHIREYKDHFIVHMDKVDPRKDPVGHLLVDAPEYLIATMAGLKAARQASCTLFTQKRGGADASVEGLRAACVSGTAAATFSYIVSSLVKERIRSI
jgi:hypothetical protein